ncbi:hypothetical protein HNQ51_003095 [Inhella inkyongensis]|uniref:DUF3261 domain-containing protein n=1 Tax=Inhella inkyongensis TaxID=392593 RepID=A0A840S8D8_9BURK|nr:DUF3261 domain-containing protein [Inhella inkyongensis]MBB5205768.1 hypothetical protein [Inhella inkyongensis]
MKVWFCLFALCLSACATPLPPSPLPSLRVLPADYARPLQLAQALTVEEAPADSSLPGVERRLDLLLQVDAHTLRLAALALNQRVLSVVWDGAQLQVQRHALLPAVVDPERVLRDIALVYAPLAALRASLPPGWHLDEQHDEQGQQRRLSHQGQLRVQVQGLGTSTVRIDNLAEHYRLRIESRPMEDG